VENLIIPEATIQKIKDEADIVKIIGEYVKLEKQGNNYKGLCPFHDDSNPSLTVSPTKKIYKCFSCNASGNVLTFIQNHNHVSFVEAVRIVGEKCGIVVETQGDDNIVRVSINTIKSSKTPLISMNFSYEIRPKAKKLENICIKET